MPDERVLMGLKIYKSERDVLQAHIERMGYGYLSDYIRGLIEADMRAQGLDFEFKVDRGGWRG